MTKLELIKCVNFVLSECDRFQTIIKEGDFKKIDRLDSLCSIPHPEEIGEIICGSAAARKLAELADEAARRAGLVRNISQEILYKEAKLGFARRFFKSKVDIDTKQVDRFLSDVARQAKLHCRTVSHFIPCHLMHYKEPHKIELGPVTFYSRSEMRKTLMDHIQQRTQASEQTVHERRLMAQAIRYYRNFRWVAQVTIKDCDKITSDRLALEAVTAGLNCLHLLVGVSHSRRMRVGGLHLSNDHRAKLQINENAMLEPSASFAYFGEVTFPDDWSQMLGPDNEYQQLLSIALEPVVDPKLLRPLSKRFLDAAQWFGEATRDESDATRIIKYATTMERLVMTGERDDITSTLSERIAAICINDKISRGEWRSIARRVYGFRSKLVHGGISPAATNLHVGVQEAVDLAEATLFYSIGAFGIEGLRDDAFNEKN
ncbi:HEPN domain-containing protein [Pseudomonas aeruginosa]|uniref:HEPN domain-containing protein n=1 Tax=Pseudomonas aeruginosa TaxID=287 RepID=UPI000F866073|nr:HEPN domain-containing protein [Pseudomonas aeruginosa]RUC92440.1 hypothetical protein IPC1387_35355 [Pseudomonas aeruginosa]